MNATPTPQDLAALRQQLGTDNANAIAVFVDGRISAAFNTHRGQLEQLANRVEGLFAQHGATPGVLSAAQAVQSADIAHRGAASQAGSSQADVDADAARIQQVTGVVDAATGAPAPSRMLTGEGDFDQRLCAAEGAINGLHARVTGVDTAVARAVAIAIGGRGGSKAAATKVFLGALVASAITYLLMAVFGPVDFTWVNQVVWPIGLAAAVSYISYLFLSNREERMAMTARVEAHATVDSHGSNPRNHGLRILPWNRAQAHGQAGGNNGEGAHASAHANANQGDVQADANAGVH